MKVNKCLIQAVIAVVTIFVSTLSSASTIYIAEIDSLQSSGYIEGANPYQISGTLKILIDGDTIQFENIDILTTPSGVSNELLIPAIGNYDGFNFVYSEYDPSLPTLGNWYAGTFDGDALFMQATTYNGTLYDFTINSSNISAVPLPSALLLFSSGIFGLFFQLKRKASNKSI